MSENTTKCNHSGELIKIELEIIKRHISQHKWFQHIENEDEAIMDFVEKYGWLMRECYCEYVCPDRDKCDLDNTMYFNDNYTKRHNEI